MNQENSKYIIIAIRIIIRKLKNTSEQKSRSLTWSHVFGQARLRWQSEFARVFESEPGAKGHFWWNILHISQAGSWVVDDRTVELRRRVRARHFATRGSSGWGSNCSLNILDSLIYAGPWTDAHGGLAT